MVNLDNLAYNYQDEIEDKRVSLMDVLNYTFRKDDIEQKTILSNTNIQALIKMKSVNKYLKSQFNFEIDLYKTLIDEKRLNIISYKGRGRDDIIRCIKSMNNSVTMIDDEKKLI